VLRAGTLTGLSSHRNELIDPKINQHGGRIANTAGDSILAEFPSVVEALRCAIDIQRGIADRNSGVPQDRRIEFRMGINVGDVMAQKGDLLGDGVNIAARLEGLAEPGGICISRAVRDQVRDRMDIDLEDMGEVEVKNIARPVWVFRVRADGVLSSSPISKTVINHRLLGSAVVLIAMAMGAGVWWWQPWAARVEQASVARMAFPLPNKPSIAVLPFDNLSGEPKLGILVDGLVEEIITSLSKIPRVFVISRNSTFTYKGRAVKVRSVAEDLGVRYVLEGSVRKSGPKLRFTAQLIDTVKGHHMWAESYDRELKEILTLQSEIALQIVTELDVKLVSGELARLQRGTTSSPDAYEAFLKAEAAPTDTKENNVAQIRMYLQATKLDSNFAAAWAAAAIRQARLGRIGLEDRDVAYRKAETLARKAIAANDTYPGAYLALSTVHRFRGEFKESLKLVEKAIALAPNDAEAIMYKGRMLRLLPGRASEAIPLIKSAMRLNPHYPPVYVAQLSWAYFAAGRYPEAHETALEYAKRKPNRDHAHWRLALTHSLLGQPDKARDAAARAIQLNPNRTIERTIKLSPYAKSNPALLKAEIEAMRAAGFPEK
jgi:TolB-like protein/Tfp pilus assembly protein PilF